MSKFLPYHHDWDPVFVADLGLRVHWFGRYAGSPEWKVEPSRLAADMMTFFFVEQEHCWGFFNGTRLELKTGDLLVIRGADEFALTHDSRRPHVSLSASIALRQGGVMNHLLHREFKRRYSLKNRAAYVAEFENVLKAFSHEGAFRDIVIAGAIVQWLAYLLQTLNPPIARTNLDVRTMVDKVLAAQAWAVSHLGKVIAIGTWAQVVGLNPDSFSRLFKRETGKRPMEWLILRRMQAAGQLLNNTRNSVTEISEACGFENAFYFSRRFKRHFGVSPQYFRRARQEALGFGHRLHDQSGQF